MKNNIFSNGKLLLSQADIDDVLLRKKLFCFKQKKKKNLFCFKQKEMFCLHDFRTQKSVNESVR
jgi:hypothetical protein